MAPRIGQQAVTIANGAGTSSAFSLRGAVAGIVIPAGTLTGGTINYQVSADGTTFVGIGTLGAQTVTGLMGWPLPSAVLGATQIRLVSNASEQGARTFTVCVTG